MDTHEPIVVKAVSNNEYFGEPGVIRAILSPFVPFAVGLSDREVLFTHRKDPEATTSISIEIHAAGSETARKVTLATLERLMNLPKLTYAVTFTEVIEDSGESFTLIVAPYAAEAGHKSFMGAVTTKLATEQADKALMERNKLSADEVWEQIKNLPMPWEMTTQAELDEANFLVDMLIPAVSEELGM